MSEPLGVCIDLGRFFEGVAVATNEQGRIDEANVLIGKLFVAGNNRIIGCSDAVGEIDFHELVHVLSSWLVHEPPCATGPQDLSGCGHTGGACCIN